MTTDRDAPPPTAPGWSYKKTACWFFVILIAVVAFVLLYEDGEAESYADLQPLRTTTPDARTNGYAYLKERWENLPELSKADREAASRMSERRVPWDSAFIAKLQTGREKMGADLHAALALPEYLTPPILQFSDLAGSSAPWLSKLSQFSWSLSLTTMDMARSGNVDGAIACIGDLHEWGRRSIEGSGSVFALMVGNQQYRSAVQLACDLLDVAKLNDAQVATLAAIWKSDPAIVEGWTAALRSEAAFMRNFLAELSDPNSTLPADAGSKTGWLRLRAKQATNRNNDAIRTLIREPFKTFPSQASAKAAGWGAARRWPASSAPTFPAAI
jgi:hypothetical protein